SPSRPVAPRPLRSFPTRRSSDLASPVIFFQSWRFVAPGLYEAEKRTALPFAIVATIFFLMGATFCYVFVFPVGFRFFLDEYASIDRKCTRLNSSHDQISYAVFCL